MSKPGWASTLLLLLVSTASSCGPSIDKAAKTDIDRRIAVMAPTGQTFPAPQVYVPKPLVVGQWTLHRLINDKGEPSLTTYKIVGEEADATWIEIANESYYDKTVTKILLFIIDRTSPAGMDIRAVKVKDKEGRVTELQGPTIQAMRSTYQNTVNMLAVSWQGLPQETAIVTAGNFTGCFKAHTDTN